MGRWWGLILGVVVISLTAALWVFRDSGDDQPGVIDPKASADTVELPRSDLATQEQPIRTVPVPQDKAAQGAPAAEQQPGKAAASPRAALRLRILTPDHQPAAGRRFELYVSYHTTDSAMVRKGEEATLAAIHDILRSERKLRDMEWSEETCDTSGYLRCAIQAARAGRLRLLEVKGGRRSRRATRGASMPWIGVLPFSAVEQKQTFVLPDVTLPRIPVLVAGRVRDEQGRPVEGADVYTIPRGSVPFRRQLMATNLQDRTDSSGHFRIESGIRDMPMVVWAHQKRERASSLVSFEAGQTELEIQVLPMGAVKGRVRLAHDLGKARPGLELRPQGTSSGFRPRTGYDSPVPRLRVTPTGKFHRGGVPAGTYDLLVSLGLTRLLRVPGIRVQSGQLCEDPRIQDLIVGQDLVLGKVRVVDEGGDPVQGARVVITTFRENGRSSGSFTGHTGPDGRASYPLPAGARVRVTSEKAGYSQAELPPGQLPATIVLKRGIELVITVTLTGKLVPSEHVAGHWLVLVPTSEVLAAEKVGRSPIPQRVHTSRIFRFKAEQTRYKLVGLDHLSYRAYVVLVSSMVTRQVGSYQLIPKAPHVLVGSLDLSVPQPDLNPTLRIDTEAVRRLTEQ